MSLNLKIAGQHLEITPALRAYVNEKVARITRCTDKALTVTVMLGVEKSKEKERRQTAQVSVHWKGEPLVLKETHEDLYAAIDIVIDRLDNKICTKTKREVEARRPAECQRRSHIDARI